MFRAWRRAALTRRLVKRRVDPQPGSDQLTSSYGGSDVSDDINQLYSVVNLFDDRQLEALADAVENGHHGGRASECVLAAAASTSSLALPPHVLCCRLWRWPSLDISVPIKRMPWCQTPINREDGSNNSQQNNRQVCCNPYHWSRLVLPDIPPPPYSKTVVDHESSLLISNDDSSQWFQQILQSDRLVDNKSIDVKSWADQDISSVDASSEDSIGSPAWCRISYWELRHRVGRQFFVSTDWTNIYQDLPHSDGISLAILQQQQTTGTDVPLTAGFGPKSIADNINSIKRTRAKIGRGIVLSRETDGVWLYNCSDYPVFVNAPLNRKSNSQEVCRLSSGYAMLVLGPCCGTNGGIACDRTGSCCGHHSVQVSFAKGWGQNYSRQSVTACPCWIEFHVDHRHHHPIT